MKPSDAQKAILLKMNDGEKIIEHFSRYTLEKSAINIRYRTFVALMKGGFIEWGEVRGVFRDFYQITQAGKDALKE